MTDVEVQTPTDWCRDRISEEINQVFFSPYQARCCVVPGAACSARNASALDIRRRILALHLDTVGKTISDTDLFLRSLIELTEES